MEWKDIFTGIGIIVSAALIISGWIFSRYKDREQERFKSRLSRREELIKQFLCVHQIIIETQGSISGREDEYNPAWIKLCGLMHLYGSDEENKCLQEFANNFIGSDKNLDGANRTLNALKAKLVSSIRSELGFK